LKTNETRNDQAHCQEILVSIDTQVRRKNEPAPSELQSQV
jgi:hypothetical protein